MQHLIKLYEHTKRLKSDLTQYEFSTDFLKKTKLFFFISLIPTPLNIFSLGIKLFV